MTETDKKTLIVGLGLSGLSVARHLTKCNCRFELADSQSCLSEALIEQEPHLADVEFHSVWSDELLQQFDRLVVSPGISIRTPDFCRAREAGVEIVGDVELFARAADKPVVAVTGSNGKSTVVGMIASILRAADLRVSMIGNLGIACLDGLADELTDVYVLELSSFQLETTVSLKPLVAAVLNVTEDHMDRYDGFEDYAATKRLIYRNADHCVYNADDAETSPQILPSVARSSFSGSGASAEWRLLESANGLDLNGPDGISVPLSQLGLIGGHNNTNALAAMAMASVVLCLYKKEPMSVFYTGLAEFEGLPHRTQLILQSNGISWFDDSKGTNVGACVSAINGMSGPVILIAGGRGKNAEFSPLNGPIQRKCRAVILIGEDAEKIQRSIGESVPVYRELKLKDAVRRAASIAESGDCVLLSPACSSFDMFANFEARGSAFASEVMQLCA